MKHFIDNWAEAVTKSNSFNDLKSLKTSCNRTYEELADDVIAHVTGIPEEVTCNECRRALGMGPIGVLPTKEQVHNLVFAAKASAQFDVAANLIIQASEQLGRIAKNDSTLTESLSNLSYHATKVREAVKVIVGTLKDEM